MKYSIRVRDISIVNGCIYDMYEYQQSAIAEDAEQAKTLAKHFFEGLNPDANYIAGDMIFRPLSDETCILTVLMEIVEVEADED